MIGGSLEQVSWNVPADGAHSHVTDSPAFETIRKEVFRRAEPGPADRCLDLGAGTGFLTLPLAERADQVVAVDASPTMSQDLLRRAGRQGLTNVDALTGDLNRLRMPTGRLDLVVSNYALHHVTDAEKREIVGRAIEWLRPGGRIVLSDMMFGRGLSAGDREVLVAKVRALAAKGPGGLWRITKNVTRFGLGVGEQQPAPPEFWLDAVKEAGFTGVGHVQVFQEAGIVWGSAPG